MDRCQELVRDGADVPDATREVAGSLLEEAAEADEPDSLLRAARQLLGLSRKMMSRRLGAPTSGRQAPTLRAWESGKHTPEWEGRKKIRALAQRLQTPPADKIVDGEYGSDEEILEDLDDRDGDLGAVADDLAEESGQDTDEIYDELQARVDEYTVETTCASMAEAALLDPDIYGEPLTDDERAELRLELDGTGQASWRVMVPQSPGAGLIRVDTVAWSEGAALR